MDNISSPQFNESTFRGETNENTTTLQEAIEEYALEKFGKYQHIEFPVTLTVCLTGFLTNTFNAVVFTRSNMINSANLLLLALSFANISFMLLQAINPVHYLFGFKLAFEYHFANFYIVSVYFETVALTLCNWLLVIIASWRLIAIKWPLKVNVLCSISRVKKVLFALILISLVFASPIFAIFVTKELNGYEDKRYTVTVSVFATEYAIFSEILLPVIFVVNAFVPLLILIVLTTLLIRSLILLKRNRRKIFNDNAVTSQNQNSQSDRITVMVTVLLVVFVINNLPDTSLTLAAHFSAQEDKTAVQTAEYVSDVIRVLALIDQSSTFFIYYFMGGKFRRTFNAIFCSCFAKKSNRSKNNVSQSISQNAINSTQSTVTINTIV